MATREVVEIPGALREEERFAFKEDAGGVEDRMVEAAKAQAEAPKAAADATREALEAQAEEHAERAKVVSERRVARARAILGDEGRVKAEAQERRPQEQPAAKAAAAKKKDSSDS